MGLFSRKAIQPQTVDPRNADRKSVDSFLANYVNTYGPLYKPGQEYTGKLTAGASEFEQRGLDEFLTGYLNQPLVSKELGDVRGMLNKTVTGGFDPGTSEYYRALREEADYNRKRSIDASRADTGARNKYFSSEAINKEGDINTQYGIAVNKMLAELGNQERTRSMQAAGYSADLEDYITNAPLERAKAATSVGALPRILEQADLEALYQDFLRRQNEKQGVLSAASGVSQAQTSQSFQAYEKSPFESYIMPLLEKAATAAGAAAMPASMCWVAAEIFGGWKHPKTEDCRFWIANIAPVWFRDLYLEHGERFAEFIKNKPILKAVLRPLFEIFASIGKKEKEDFYAVA